MSYPSPTPSFDLGGDGFDFCSSWITTPRNITSAAVRSKCPSSQCNICIYVYSSEGVKFNGRLEYKQYMKSKPTSWGIKVWCSACPTSGYLLDFSIYTGKLSQPLIGGCLYILSVILFLIHFHLAVHVCLSVSQDCLCLCILL